MWWIDGLPHSCMLPLQTDRFTCLLGIMGVPSFQRSIVAVLNPVISPARPGLACREPAADHTPRYA